MTIDVKKIGTTIAGKPLGIATKALGVATVASVIYDAHVNGQERANINDEISSADRFMDIHRQYMTMNKPSATLSSMKRGLYYSQIVSPVSHFFNKAGGYISGFVDTLGQNLPVLGLSALTMVANKKTGKVGNIIGKASGVVLGLSWLSTYMYEVLGFTSKKTEKHY